MIKDIKYLARLLCALILLSPWASSAHAIDDDLIRRAVSDHTSKRGYKRFAEPYEIVNLDDCKNHEADLAETIDGVKETRIDTNTSVVLTYTSQCNGGNKNGQYLLLIKNGIPRLILENEIDDMSFLVTGVKVAGHKIVLTGSKWEKQDAHCCPSKKGKLIYDINTHAYTYDLRLAN